MLHVFRKYRSGAEKFVRSNPYTVLFMSIGFVITWILILVETVVTVASQ